LELRLSDGALRKGTDLKGVVRSAPKATEVLHCRKMTRFANNRYSRTKAGPKSKKKDRLAAVSQGS
jgi:hypothetical protein